MALFGEKIRRMAQQMQSCEEWLEMVRDLQQPVHCEIPSEIRIRWAEREDLFSVSRLAGFSRDIEEMERSLDAGDRCLLLETQQRLGGFAWVTFRDFRMALWYTLRLPPGSCYLEYIVIHPRLMGRGFGSCLLGALLSALQNLGYHRVISGMYSDWNHSIRLHEKMGFIVHRRLTQCRIWNIFPIPPTENPISNTESGF